MRKKGGGGRCWLEYVVVVLQLYCIHIATVYPAELTVKYDSRNKLISIGSL